MFNNKRILITGGTGSFGRHCVKTLLEKHKPSEIVVLSRDEQKQYEMRIDFPHRNLRFELGDVREPFRLIDAFHGVDIVIHAAALKQVPLAETNPGEFIRTNVNGSENVVHAAIACGVSQVLFISTDKAVMPINLYGATKMAAEKLCIAADSRTDSLTRFATVRYGNVANSRGSVAPFFQRLTASGAKELPITDERMTRFWISIEQGVDFALKSLSRMQGGEIFVPKIPSLRITDLAKAVAPKAKIRFVGIRPGEKLHEMLVSPEQSHLTFEFKDHFVLTPSFASVKRDYSVNPLKEKGKPVKAGYEFTSLNNPDYLTVSDIKKMF